MAFRSSRTGRGSHIVSQKRLTLWAGFQPLKSAFTATGGTILFSLSAAGLALRPFTIVRTRLLISVNTDQVAADESQVGAFGVAVVSDQAVAVGVTAVPTPITDMDSDLWLVHQLMYSEFFLNTAVGFDAGGMVPVEVDSKAMRKVELGQDVILVGEFSAAGNGFIMTVGGRMLLKLN